MSTLRKLPRAESALVALTVVLAFTLGAACSAGAARAAIYGSDPLNISVGPGGEAADGASGGAAISGDNRFARLAAFHSDATNLAGGDTNAARDVFVWRRPRGSAGLALDRPGLGRLTRVSVSTAGAQADGPSQNPALDGNIKRAPHCVVFESRATNLSSGDRTPDWDIYLRDLRRGRTRLISRGLTDATQPTISGDCRRIAFTAGGRIHTALARRPRPHRLRAGTAPDYSYDGRALAWQHDGRIKLRWSGSTIDIGTGTTPKVSDAAHRRRVVGYQNNGIVRMAIANKRRVASRRTVTPGPGTLAGVTAFAADRGIIVFALRSSLYYLNRHTGNKDDLAHASSTIEQADASARANFVTFTATGGADFIGDGNGATPDVYIKHLVDGRRL